MIKLEDAQITQVLPYHLSSQSRTQALSRTVNFLLNLLLSYVPGAMLYTNTSNLSEDVIDAMAVDLRTPFYDETLALEVKKELVKNTIYWHSIAGTPEAIEKLIEVVFGEGEIKEWYESDLTAGHFTVNTINERVTNKKAEDFLRLLESIKRKSQHLDSVQIVSDGQLGINVFIATIEDEEEITTVR